MSKATATFQNGSREVTATVTSSSEWAKDTMTRIYFDLSFEGAKLGPVAKLYEIIEGGTSDHTIQSAGRTFGYQLGICCDSKTKRAAATEAIESLVAQITAQ